MTTPASPIVDNHVLATDLDGTLIPLSGESQNVSDLRILADQLKRHDIALVYVTGRYFESVERAIELFQLPEPAWVICDVGTTILQRDAAGTFQPAEAYRRHQEEIIGTLPIHTLRDQLQSISGLRLQEEEKQGQFKLSYYVAADQLHDLAGRIQQELTRCDAPYSVITSIDPFNGDGLIDLLPRGVSKAHALAWWVEQTNLHPDAIVFAGDSGNDLAAFQAGYRTVVVGNADRQLAQQVYHAHREAGCKNRLYFAAGTATSGVLEGCRWFGLADPAKSTVSRLGATPLASRTTRFRVWAPRCKNIAVELTDGERQTIHALSRQADGYFTGDVTDAPSGALYKYLLDEQHAYPDPASKFQPQGVHQATQVIAPGAFPWSDRDWQGIPKRELIIYELHVGTFTQAGTYRGVIERLPELVDLGITAIEIMPVAQTPGRWNWGYDGVNLFAPRNSYGEPDDLKALIDACHAKGIAVILDVVYNHVGPEGNYLAPFGPYFSKKHHTPWGDAFNFDGPDSQEVRRFIIENAIYWLEEYHLDGLRLDAVHFMFDDSKPTILEDIRCAVSEFAARADRTLHLIAESNVYAPDLLEVDEGRQAYDAIWSDCLLHAIYAHAVPNVKLTEREYQGASDIIEVLQYGYLYSDRTHQRVSPDDRRQNPGTSPIGSFVTALQTHDAVGNHPHGKRLHQLTSKSFQKAAVGMALLYPGIPLIFMGEEYATTSTFPFFVDFEDKRLRKAVDKGRANEFPNHEWAGATKPSAVEAFQQAICDIAQHRDDDMANWYRQLIRLRKQGLAEGWLAASQMLTSHQAGDDIFCLRFDCREGGAVIVLSRLTPADRQDIPGVEVMTAGRLLLSSEPGCRIAEGRVVLQPNHVVIVRS